MARCSKMIVIFSIFIVFASTCSALGAGPDTNAYCFQFTWLGLTTPDNVNCTKLTHTPCIQPFVITTEKSQTPNVTYMWEKLNRTAISCQLSSGFACIKYSYYYNNAALNITHFCGKMTEDKTLPITNGCYTEKVNGHIVEACACQSSGGMMPCNSSIRTSSSIRALIVLTSISMFVYGGLIGTGFSFDVQKLPAYS